jgi:hypothetical protein
MAETIDSALELLRDCGPEFHRLSNHGPMAAEALLTLGRDDAVVGWVERYRERLQPHPEPTDPIDADTWQQALGDFQRVGDWRVFFDREIAEHGAAATIATWVPRFIPGLAAAGFHGIIRTAHAVRSLQSGQTELRLGELAEGLAFWAARYQTMPGAPSPAGGGLPPEQALARVPKLPEEKRVRGLVSDELASLDGFDAFRSVIDLVDTSDAQRCLSQITSTFARVYLANADHAGFSFIHALTGPSALRLLLPSLDESEWPRAVQYAWQAAAGLYAVAARAPGVERDPVDIDDDELIDRAVATRDEHAIKFTEACLREERLAPDPVFRAAASDLASRLRAPA